MNPLLLAVLLQLLAVAVLITEVIIPSGGLLGILAAGLIGYSLYSVFTEVSTNTGYLFLVVDVVTLPVIFLAGLKLLAKSPATLRKDLSTATGVTSQAADLEAYLGKAGVTVTNLRPSGIALIEGRRLDVVSRGEYIEKDAPIVVSAVTGNQIIVKIMPRS
ncbi:MAG: NfeD family protein [Thermodesulfobacteriota bacterium]